jgi:hypothetical protein
MALTADFDSPIQNKIATTQYIATTGAVIFRGGLLQLDSAGKVGPAVAGSALKIVGRAAQSLDGTEPAGTVVTAEEGDIFLKLNGSATPVQATVGASVYAATDFEIYTTNTAGKAGTLVRLATVNGVSGGYVRCTLANT